MKSRLLVAAVGVPLVFVLLVILPPWGTALLCAAISCLAAHEIFSAVGVKSPAAVVLGCLSALAVTAAAWLSLPLPWVLAWGAVAVLLLFALWVAYYEKERPFGFAGLGAGLLACLVIPGGMAALVLLRQGERGAFAVLLPILITFVGDAGALFTGMALGRHKLAPRTSPKKTVEGAVGGLLSSVLAALLFWLVLRYAFSVACDLPRLLLLALAGGLVSQLGDLAFSLIKREFGVKDYGKLLPGHGGALDRFDSTIFAAPVIYLLAEALRIWEAAL